MNDYKFFELIEEFRSFHDQTLIAAEKLEREVLKRKKNYDYEGVKLTYHKEIFGNESVTIEVDKDAIIGVA